MHGADPEVGFVSANISVSEGLQSVSVDISASGATSVEFFLERGSATGLASCSFKSLKTPLGNIHRTMLSL